MKKLADTKMDLRLLAWHSLVDQFQDYIIEGAILVAVSSSIGSAQERWVVTSDNREKPYGRDL
jgi:hypothetical protein